MALIALTILALLVGRSFAFPFDYGFGGLGSFGGLGYGGCGDVWDVGCGDDFGGYGWGYGGYDGYGDYPGAVGVARENYVRRSYWGGREYGTRVTSYRPGCFRPPYSRNYWWNFPRCGSYDSCCYGGF